MTAKPFDLGGKVAIFTGGNGGIGLGIAYGLGEAGAALAIIGRNMEKSERASPGSDFVTGTAIPVDGGYSIMG